MGLPLTSPIQVRRDFSAFDTKTIKQPAPLQHLATIFHFLCTPGRHSNMALELHNLPPWSEDSKKAVVQQLQLDVRKTLSTKPEIRPPVVQFHASIGVPEPIYEELNISKSEIRLLDLALTED